VGKNVRSGDRGERKRARSPSDERGARIEDEILRKVTNRFASLSTDWMLSLLYSPCLYL
jgi:hypothetical protein